MCKCIQRFDEDYFKAKRDDEIETELAKREYEMTANSEYPYVWFWKSKLPERKGQRCKVNVRGKMNSIEVEFEDGYRVVTSRFAVRKAK